jgi:hypothetical protein
MYIYRQNVIVHLRPNGILRSPNCRKARDKARNSIHQSKHRLRFLSCVVARVAAGCSGSWSISWTRMEEIKSHIALWKKNSHWIVTASSVFSFLNRTKALCQYSIFTLLRLNFFYSWFVSGSCVTSRHKPSIYSDALRPAPTTYLSLVQYWLMTFYAWLQASAAM